MSEIIYPRIIVGLTDPNFTPIEELIKTRLLSDKINPTLSFFNFFDLTILENTTFQNEVKDADFCIFLFTDSDYQKLSKIYDNPHEDVRLVFHYLIGTILAIMEKNRISVFSSSQHETPILSKHKNIMFTAFNGEEKKLESALRIALNKIVLQIKEYGIRDKQMFNIESEGILDHLMHYSIQILNPVGDTVLTRKIHMEASEERLSSRVHKILCDTSTSSFDELDLRAWDEDGRELKIEKTYDTPVKKDFKVLFRDQLFPGDKLIYTYGFRWKGMFPPEGSNFFLGRTAKKIFFDLILPNSWDLLYVDVIEKRLDGSPSHKTAAIKRLDESEEDNFIRYSFQLEEFDAGIMETEIKWNWKAR